MYAPTVFENYVTENVTYAPVISYEKAYHQQLSVDEIIMARAKNGTGKTGTYSIPILENIDTFKDYKVSKLVCIFISYLFTIFK